MGQGCLSGLLGAKNVKTTSKFVRNPEHEKRLRSIFDESDVDKSGDITIDELGEALRKDAEWAAEYGLPQVMQYNDEQEVSEIFKYADKDASGSISFEEFFEALESVHEGRQLRKKRSKSLQSVSKPVRLEAGQKFVEDARIKVWDWKIDYWNLDPSQELTMVMQALELFGCLEHFHLNVDTLATFFSEVKATYRKNPYHNFQHALATTHFSFKLLDESGCAKVMDKEDLLAVIIGAVCHDCDHRGRNNAFEVATKSELAVLYNDRSPLENHHCAVAFQIILSTSKNCNIFKSMEDATFRRVRQRMTAGILGTDMALHNGHVSKLQSVDTLSDLQHDGGDLVDIFMHAADIGNPMMHPDISARWGKAIAAEFIAQSEDEKKLGLPLTAMLLGLEDPKKAAKSQIGFIDFVFSPLAKPLFALCPLLEQPKRFAEENRELTKKAME